MIIPLAPSVQRKIWGGTKLEKMKNIPHNPLAVEGVGETWEISVHRDGPSFVDGKPLSINSNEELNYLVKLIDTGDVLSIQVHPGDEYARLHENSLGKSECWLILDAEEGEGIYLGLKSGVTKEVLLKALNEKAQINELLNFYPVKAGDFFYVPAGSIHAIGKGITLAEIQQSSGITYRVWDWNRVDSKGNPRELHVKKSLDVINFASEANEASHFKIKHGLFNQDKQQRLLSHELFKVDLINLRAGDSIELSLLSDKRLPSLMSLNALVDVNGHELREFSSVLIKGETHLKINALQDSSLLFIF